MDPRSSLELATQLDRAKVPADEGHWLLNVYPEAAEASGCFQGASGPEDARRSWEPDPDRSGSEAARRARGQVRRYCAAHRLTRLGTLTYGPPFCRDPLILRRDVAAFFRKLRGRTGRLPYVWVPELHADGERFHLHFGVGRFIRRGWIEDAWPHGYIWIHSHGDLSFGSGTLGEARATARYLAKYVGKSFGRQASGLHRYEVAQGFQPAVRRVTGRTVDVVLKLAAEIMGADPERVWRSRDEETWAGPPAVWASWD